MPPFPPEQTAGSCGDPTFNPLRGCGRFSRAAALSCIPTARRERSELSPSSPALTRALILALLMGGRRHLIVVSICISPMTGEAEGLPFVYLSFSHRLSFSEKGLFRYLPVLNVSCLFIIEL